MLNGVGRPYSSHHSTRASHVYHLYVIQSSARNELQQYLSRHKIGTLIHYPVPPYLQQCYSSLNLSKDDFPISHKLSNTLLSIPLWPGMTRAQQEYVVDTYKEFLYCSLITRNIPHKQNPRHILCHGNLVGITYRKGNKRLKCKYSGLPIVLFV